MEMPIRNAMTKTQQLFESFFRADPRTATTESIRYLEEMFKNELTESVRFGYMAALAPLDDWQQITAFSRALEECRYFPSPSILREFSGRAVTGDPLAAEAKAELLKLIQGMRGPHGPMLKPIWGAVLYGSEDDPKDANGQRVPYCDAPRAESTVFPIARRTEAALVRLGWGDRSAGIALIADHPAVKRKQQDGDDQYRQNQLRAGDEILNRFVDAYREE
jgi:hypothetical protein